MSTRGHALTEALAAESVYRASVERALQARVKREDDLEDSITTASGEATTDLSTHIADTTTHGISAFGATLVDDASASAARTTLAAAGSGAVTSSGLTMATARLLGRTTASTGAIEEITVGSGLSLSAGSLTSTVSAPTEGHGIDISGTAIAVDETELSYDTPVAVGATLSAGSAATLVRSDHVHTIGAAGFEQGTVLYEVDFSSLATNALTAGTESIDGLDWTVAGDTFLGTFSITNGTGLQMVAGTSLGTHSTWTSATQDAPYLYLPLSSITNWNGVSDIIIDLYISSLTLESANEYVFCAFWHVGADPHSTSSARVRKFTWINVTGNIVPSVTNNASQTNGTEVRSGQNVMSFRLSPNGVAQGSWGTWSSGWPAQQNGTILASTVVTALDPMLRGSTRLVIGMGVLNDASPTTQAVIQRMRVRRA